MARMSVLHFVDKFGVAGSGICGVTRLFQNWVPRFRELGIDSKVICLKAPAKAQELLAQSGVEVGNLGKKKGDPTTLLSIFRHMHDLKPDIVHLHGYGAGFFGRIAAFSLGIPAVLHEHGVDPNFPIFQEPAEMLVAPMTAWAIGVSSSVARFLISKRHIASNRVSVVFNGAPISDFKKHGPEEGAELRVELGIPADRIVIGAIGRLAEQKGIRYLIDAFPKVLAARPNAHLLIVGDGPLEKELKQQALDRGLGTRITMAGFRADAAKCFAAIDVFVMPSLYEGLPLTALEAMAAGKAIVVTPVDGLGEIFQDRKTALFVQPQDPDGIALRVLELLACPNLMMDLSKSCQKTVLDFDIGATVAKVSDIYESTLRSRRR